MFYWLLTDVVLLKVWAYKTIHVLESVRCAKKMNTLIPHILGWKTLNHPELRKLKPIMNKKIESKLN